MRAYVRRTCQVFASFVRKLGGATEARKLRMGMAITCRSEVDIHKRVTVVVVVVDQLGQGVDGLGTGTEGMVKMECIPGFEPKMKAPWAGVWLVNRRGSRLIKLSPIPGPQVVTPLRTRFIQPAY